MDGDILEMRKIEKAKEDGDGAEREKEKEKKNKMENHILYSTVEPKGADPPPPSYKPATSGRNRLN